MHLEESRTLHALNDCVIIVGLYIVIIVGLCIVIIVELYIGDNC